MNPDNRFAASLQPVCNQFATSLQPNAARFLRLVPNEGSSIASNEFRGVECNLCNLFAICLQNVCNTKIFQTMPKRGFEHREQWFLQSGNQFETGCQLGSYQPVDYKVIVNQLSRGPQQIHNRSRS